MKNPQQHPTPGQSIQRPRITCIRKFFLAQTKLELYSTPLLPDIGPTEYRGISSSDDMTSGTPSNNGRKLSHSTWHPPRSPAPVTQKESSPEDGASALHHSPEGASRPRLRKKPSFNMKVCDSAGGLLLLGLDTTFLLPKNIAFKYFRNRYYDGLPILLLSVLCTERLHCITRFCIRHIPCLLAALYAESTAQALKNTALRPRRVRR